MSSPFRLFVGGGFDHTHEREQMNKIVKQLKKIYEKSSEWCVLFLDIVINGGGIDGLVFKEDQIVIIEAKRLNGTFEVEIKPEKNKWCDYWYKKVDGNSKKELLKYDNGKQIQPLKQLYKLRKDVINFIEKILNDEQINAQLSTDKLDDIPRFISCCLVLEEGSKWEINDGEYKKGYGNNKEFLKKEKWLQIVTIDEIGKKISISTSPRKRKRTNNKGERDEIYSNGASFEERPLRKVFKEKREKIIEITKEKAKVPGKKAKVREVKEEKMNNWWVEYEETPDKAKISSKRQKEPVRIIFPQIDEDLKSGDVEAVKYALNVINYLGLQKDYKEEVLNLFKNKENKTEIRLLALESFCDFLEENEELTPYILDYADDPDYLVSEEVVKNLLLSDEVYNNEAVTEKFLEILNTTKDKRKLFNAVLVLGKTEDKRAVRPLLEVGEKHDIKIWQLLRKNIILALGKIGSTESVDFILKHLKTHDPILCESALEALAEIGDGIKAKKKVLEELKEFGEAYEPKYKMKKAVESVGEIVVEIERFDKNPSLREYYKCFMLNKIIEAMKNIGGSKAVPYIKEYLTYKIDEDYDYWRIERVNSSAAKALVEIGCPEALDALTEFLKRDFSEEDERDVIIEVIATLGEFGDEKAVEPLIKLLEKENPNIVRWITLDALAKIGDKRSLKPILEFLKDSFKKFDVGDSDSEHINLLTSEVRDFLKKNTTKEDFDLLWNILKDALSTAKLSEKTNGILEILAKIDSNKLETRLIEMLESSHVTQKIVKNILWLLFIFHISSKKSVEWCINNILKNEEMWRKEGAEKIIYHTFEIIEDTFGREAAFYEDFKNQIEELLKSENPQIRGFAMQVIARWEKDKSKAIDIIISFKNDPEVKDYIIPSLICTESEKALPLFIEYLNNPDPKDEKRYKNYSRALWFVENGIGKDYCKNNNIPLSEELFNLLKEMISQDTSYISLDGEAKILLKVIVFFWGDAVRDRIISLIKDIIKLKKEFVGVTALPIPSKWKKFIFYHLIVEEDEKISRKYFEYYLSTYHHLHPYQINIYPPEMLDELQREIIKEIRAKNQD